MNVNGKTNKRRQEDYDKWEKQMQEESRYAQQAQLQFEIEIEDLRIADMETAKQLFKRLVKQYHPDVGGDGEKIKIIFDIYYNKKKRWY